MPFSDRLRGALASESKREIQAGIIRSDRDEKSNNVLGITNTREAGIHPGLKLGFMECL